MSNPWAACSPAQSATQSTPCYKNGVPTERSQTRTQQWLNTINTVSTEAETWGGQRCAVHSADSRDGK